MELFNLIRCGENLLVFIWCKSIVKLGVGCVKIGFLTNMLQWGSGFGIQGVESFQRSSSDLLKTKSIAIYIPLGDSSTKFLLDGAMMYEQRFQKHAGYVIGLNAQVIGVNVPGTNHKNIVFTSSLLIGYRGFFKAAKGINLSPELWYNIGLVQMGGLNEDYKARPRYIHIGVSDRMKIFTGSIYINSGPLIRFVGLRAGISL